jgi:hypothetical protein
VIEVQQAQLDQLVQQGQPGHKDKVDHRGSQVIKVTPEERELLVPLDRLVGMVA